MTLVVILQYSPDTQYTPRGSLCICSSSLSLSFSLSYFSLSIIILLDYLLVFCSRHNCFISSFLFFSFFSSLSLSFSFFFSGCSPLFVTLLRLLPYYYPTPTPCVLFLSFFFFLLLLPPRPLLRCLLSSDHEAMLALQITRRQLVLILSVFDLVQTP